LVCRLAGVCSEYGAVGVTGSGMVDSVAVKIGSSVVGTCGRRCLRRRLVGGAVDSL
jgi:hypothetical protein